MAINLTKNFKIIDRNDEIFTKDTRYPRDQSVMQNRMIEAWNSMSIDEKRIFILASPLVRLCDATEKTKFAISAKDYAEACKIEVSSAYSQLKQAADNLRGRYFSYINTSGKRVSVHWVIRIEYNDAEISFCFPDEVLFMLSVFDSQNTYTRFKIETALRLKGAHSLQ
ncbi:replication initiation protein, partial [Acinetobacter lwoffii]